MVTDKERTMERRGRLWRTRLQKEDTLLHPRNLTGLLPAYASYRELFSDGRLLARDGLLDNVPEKKPGKLLVLISGPAGAGKDEIRKRMDIVLPGKSDRLITATSRKRRDDEVHGRDYYFFDGVDAFQQAIDDNQFVEFSVQGSPRDGTLRLYGTPKQSIRDALQRQVPMIVSHVEISEGWPNVARYARKLPERPGVVRLFVLPEMNAGTYFGAWLPEKRPTDYDERGARAGWEIWRAPKIADMFVRNVVGERETALLRAAEEIVEVLTDRFVAT